MLYMVTFTINIPQMLANIPAPWILWGMICSIAVSDYRRGYVLSYFLQYIFHFFAHMLVLSPFWRVSQDESANGIRLLLADSVSAVFYPMKFHEIPRYSWFASHMFHPFHPFHIFSYLFIISPTLWWAFRNVQDRLVGHPLGFPKGVPLKGPPLGQVHQPDQQRAHHPHPAAVVPHRDGGSGGWDLQTHHGGGQVEGGDSTCDGLVGALEHWTWL